MQTSSLDQNNDNIPQKSESELLDHIYQYQKSKRQQIWRKTIIIFALLTILSAASWQGYIYSKHQHLVGMVPQSIRQNINFPIYLPTQSNSSPNQQSFNYSSGVLIFTAGSNDMQLTIMQQQRSADFELGKFSVGEGLTEIKELTINGNKVLQGKLNGHSIGIVDTGQSIVTMTSIATVSSETMAAIIKSLQKI